MPYMQDIEAAVRQHDSRAFLSCFGNTNDQFVGFNYSVGESEVRDKKPSRQLRLLPFQAIRQASSRELEMSYATLVVSGSLSSESIVRESITSGTMTKPSR